MKVEDRSRILKAIARGRTWLQELLSGQIAGTEEIAVRERCSERSIRMTLSLAFLSPELVQAIIAGRLPRGIGMNPSGRSAALMERAARGARGLTGSA